MLGAFLGGTTRGAHHWVELIALSLITPPNSGWGAGSCLPLMVVVALGEPILPATYWAIAVVPAPKAVIQLRMPVSLGWRPVSVAVIFFRFSRYRLRLFELIPFSLPVLSLSCRFRGID